MEATNAVEAPLFGYIRDLLASDIGHITALDTLRRIETFIATRAPRGVAALALAAIQSPDLSDVEILKRLRELVAPSSEVVPLGVTNVHFAHELCCRAKSKGGREQSRLKDVATEMKLIETNFPSYSREGFAYLDVGCAEGRITAAFAEALRMPPGLAHACDITPQQFNSAFTFTENETDRLPYETASFDFVTMFMAAHHFADAKAMFIETRRVMRSGGYLLIRDHDCTEHAQWLFYDVVHALYACVLGVESTPEEFVTKYAAGGFAHYRSRKDWACLACECGFELHPETSSHGPVVRGKYGNDRFDSFYVLLRACTG